jgi:hypothetical protein
LTKNYSKRLEVQSKVNGNGRELDDADGMFDAVECVKAVGLGVTRTVSPCFRKNGLAVIWEAEKHGLADRVTFVNR